MPPWKRRRKSPWKRTTGSPWTPSPRSLPLLLPLPRPRPLPLPLPLPVPLDFALCSAFRFFSSSSACASTTSSRTSRRASFCNCAQPHKNQHHDYSQTIKGSISLHSFNQACNSKFPMTFNACSSLTFSISGKARKCSCVSSNKPGRRPWQVAWRTESYQDGGHRK